METNTVNESSEMILQTAAAEGNRRFLCREYTILVADESEDGRREVSAGLSRFGISVDGAQSTEQALRLSGEHRYDMIFLRDGLTGLAGSETTKAIARTCAEDMTPPLLFLLTDDAADETQSRSREQGFDGCLLTTPGEEELCDFLEHWVPKEQRQYLEDDGDEEAAQDRDVIRLFMSGVDVVSAIQKNGGIDDYIDLLDIFYTDGLKRKGSLRDKIKNQDIQNYTIEVHGLKSAAANIGADALSAIAKQHEAYGNASDLDAIREHEEELFDSYELILCELERVLKDLGIGRFAKQDASLPSIERADMISRMHQILECLEDFQSKEAAKGMEELLSYAIPEDVKPQLDEIQIMLKMYEDDDAEDKLRELLEGLD